VDRPRHRGVLAGGIVHGVVAEGNVADHRVEEIIRQACLFKPLREDCRVPVKLFCDAGRDGVQFDTRPPAAGQPGSRESGIRPKKCPTPIEGSRICAPVPSPKRSIACQSAWMTITDVKCAFGVEARAELYSSGSGVL
jgi:hypothetical protein